MKKFLIALAAVITLVACKSKDDNDAPNQLIGGWKLESITEGNELQKLTECEKNVIIYSATETEEIFFKEDSNGNCVYRYKPRYPTRLLSRVCHQWQQTYYQSRRRS